MSNRPRGTPDPSRRPLTKRQQAYYQREANLQRRVVLGIAGAVVVAILLLAGGVVYDQVLVPGRTVKAVNGQTLSRGDYDRIARNAALQQIAQSAQYAKLLGPNASFGQNQGGSFSEQVVQANQQLAQLGTIRGRSQPVTDETVNQWVDAELVAQGAKKQFKIDPAQGEVDQVIVARLGSLLKSPESPTSTTTLMGTPGAKTTAVGGTAAPGGAVSATTAAGQTAPARTPAPKVTPTIGPSPTASPTAPPTASPLPKEATAKAEQIFGIIYDEYTSILNDLPKEASSDIRSPHASRSDFAASLRAQYRDELIRTLVKEKLVPTVKSDDTSAPTQIHARHILLKVPKPSPTPTRTPAPNATGQAESTASAAATAQPTVTPTLAPAVLDKLYAERKKEADAIYEQLKKNPASFPELARQKSEDEGSASRGGDLGTFGKGQMVKPFEDAAYKLKDNEISPPVRSEFGWHIIQRLAEDPKDKLDRQRQTAFDDWLKGLHKNATIVPAPTVTPTELPVPSPAQTEAAPPPGATGSAPAATRPPAAPAATIAATAAP